MLDCPAADRDTGNFTPKRYVRCNTYPHHNRNVADSGQAPAIVKLICDIHGLGYFFLSDMCCVKCEQDLYMTAGK